MPIDITQVSIKLLDFVKTIDIKNIDYNDTDARSE